MENEVKMNALTDDERKFARKRTGKTCVVWGDLDSEDWARMLEVRPDFAARCDWSKFDFSRITDYRLWISLIKARPEVAEKCGFWSEVDDGVHVEGTDWMDDRYVAVIRKTAFRAGIKPGGEIEYVCGREEDAKSWGYMFDAEIVEDGLCAGKHIVAFVQDYAHAWSAVDQCLNDSN